MNQEVSEMTASNKPSNDLFDDGYWEKHSKKHWSRMLMGHKLDYYPKFDKFQYRGKVYFNNVLDFIRTNGRSHSRF